MRMRCAAAIVLAACLISNQPTRAATRSFVFQNNFWVNLHHLVRGEARRRSLHLPLVLAPDLLNAEEQRAWNRALDAYVELANKELVFDADLVRINNALTRVSAASLPPGIVDEPTRRALNAAAPVYRAHGWPEQRRLNDAWIAQMRPVVERHAVALVPALVKAYRTKMPSKPIIVDACEEAGPNAAYTTQGPGGTQGHTTIDVRAEHNTGDPGLEIVFHEASHTLNDHVIDAIRKAAARLQVEVPDNLAHALLFYTTGELVRRELARTGEPHYVPYADRFGIYNNGWLGYRAALEREWQPYLDGKIGFDEALEAVVRDAGK